MSLITNKKNKASLITIFTTEQILVKSRQEPVKKYVRKCKQRGTKHKHTNELVDHHVQGVFELLIAFNCRKNEIETKADKKIPKTYL